MNKQEKFNDDMEHVFIPTIERMLQAEQAHLAYLKTCGLSNDLVSGYINYSTNMVNHLKQRL